jgi:peptidoglycan/xylan/chitin deacetylase (PgdA/CDA1 family)
MNGRFRAIALGALVFFAVAGYIGYRLFRASTPPVPAVVLRHANAAALVSKSIPARVDRLLHDRYAPISERDRNARLIALTFDDGPYPVETPLLLDELADLHVPATFFLIGDDTELFPDFAARIEAQGDEIANHTMTHPARFDALPPAAVTKELRDGAATLERYVRDPAIRTMMRPPHGRYTLRTLQTAQRDGYDVVLWNDDPGDWRSVPARRILDHMEANATAPEIVLLHSGRLNTIEALPEIVSRFRAAGYTFVTVGRLLAKVPATQVLHPAKLRV